ncbi:MAG: hypothetical protein PHV77_06295 [Candidatus Omnitrophica bacterium]|nr:hypothetical protein [Candidatus Omnitrophota bacterium]
MARRGFRLFAAWVLVVACLASCGYALADDGCQSAGGENKVVKFFKGVFKWPFSVTKQGAETVGRTTKAGVTTVANTGVSAVETVTGKPEKIKDVIVEPVKGTAETGYTAAEGGIKTPVEGTKEAFE